MTTGPPMSSAIAAASSGVLAKPCLVTGIPAFATIARDSYSKKRIALPEATDDAPMATPPPGRADSLPHTQPFRLGLCYKLHLDVSHKKDQENSFYRGEDDSSIQVQAVRRGGTHGSAGRR